MLVQYRNTRLLREPELTKAEESEIKIFGHIHGKPKKAIKDNAQYRVLGIMTPLAYGGDDQGMSKAIVMKDTLDIEGIRSDENWPIPLPFSEIEIIDDAIPDNWQTAFFSNSTDDGTEYCCSITGPSEILGIVEPYRGFRHIYVEEMNECFERSGGNVIADPTMTKLRNAYIDAENRIDKTVQEMTNLPTEDEECRKLLTPELFNDILVAVKSRLKALHMLSDQRQKEISACRILRDLAGINYAEDYDDIRSIVPGELMAMYKETKEKHHHDMDLIFYRRSAVVERLLSIPI